MLELARKLAENDERFFAGWIMAEAAVSVKAEVVRLENRVVFIKKRLACLEVLGYAADGSIGKSLRVTLVLPLSLRDKAVLACPEDKGELVARHAFTCQEVFDYVSYTGDRNIIHTGAHPIVPGLCLLAWLQQARRLKAFDMRIGFVRPVYTGEEVAVFQHDGEIAGYVGAALVFSSK